MQQTHAGYVGTCPGRISGGGPGRSYGVYLHLAGPEALLLENLMGEVDLLEPERHVTVTREENHQETLARHHSTTRPLTRGRRTRLVQRVTRQAQGRLCGRGPPRQ